MIRRMLSFFVIAVLAASVVAVRAHDGTLEHYCEAWKDHSHSQGEWPTLPDPCEGPDGIHGSYDYKIDFTVHPGVGGYCGQTGHLGEDGGRIVLENNNTNPAIWVKVGWYGMREGANVLMQNDPPIEPVGDCPNPTCCASCSNAVNTCPELPCDVLGSWKQCGCEIEWGSREIGPGGTETSGSCNLPTGGEPNCDLDRVYIPGTDQQDPNVTDDCEGEQLAWCTRVSPGPLNGGIQFQITAVNFDGTCENCWYVLPDPVVVGGNDIQELDHTEFPGLPPCPPADGYNDPYDCGDCRTGGLFMP